MIEAKNICKSFNGKLVIDDISVLFKQGKVNMIIGKSGSGKSVLTKCLIGLYPPDSGEVYYNEREFISLSNLKKKEIRKEIGMLFQAGALFDYLTVEENVKFPLRMFTNMAEDEMRDRVNFCLQRVNLENVNHLYPSETSGGMQKRVGIARAISMKPQYLFCDEPNSGLDPQTAIVIDNLIHEITHEYAMTTVVVTHDMNSVMEVGDHVMFIHDGKKWWEGTNRDILRSGNEELDQFVYASEFMQKVKESLLNS